MFQGCIELEQVTIADGITSIDDYAFYACEALKSITIPKSVTHIGEFALGCASLDDIYYAGSKAEWNSIELEPRWNDATSAQSNSFTVHCTDGDISIDIY